MRYHINSDKTRAKGHRALILSEVLERIPTRYVLPDALARALPTHIMLLDCHGVIVDINEAWRRFVHNENNSDLPGDGIGTKYVTLCRQIFGTSAEGVREIEVGIRRVLAGTRLLFSTELSRDSPMGRQWWLIQAVALMGNVGGATVSQIDITESKLRTQEQIPLLAQEHVRRADIGMRRAEAKSLRATNAEHASQVRLEALQALTDTSLFQLALEDLLPQLLSRIRAALNADSAAILLLDRDRQVLTIRAACGPEEELVGKVEIPAGQGVDGHIAASRAPLIVSDLSTYEGATHLPREKLRSLAGVPLLIEDRLVGILHVGSATEHHFTDQDMRLLQLAADRIALAVDRARMLAAEQDARVRAEEALARATECEERLQTILEAVADGVAVSDRDGRIVQTNRAFRAMLTMDRAPENGAMLPSDHDLPMSVRHAAHEPLASEQLAVPQVPHERVVQGASTDIHIRSLDGRELELQTTAAPLRDHNGNVTGAVVVARDITWSNLLEREREEARANELALQEATQRMDEFLATASHDLRSPLAVAMGTIEMAITRFERLVSAMTPQASELADKIVSVRGCLDEASRSADRLRRLVTVLFDTSQARAASMELHREPCDLAAVVREQVDALRVANPRHTIDLTIPSHDPTVRVVADADRVGQVVMNYLSNALKYSLEDQRIAVRVELKNAWAQVSVADHGPGIPASEQDRIWQRFYRVRDSHVRNGSNSGLGLGLHICETIVKQHGGQVGLESAVGAGSTFWFTLPLE